MSEPMTAAGALDEWLEKEYRREYGADHPLIVEIDRLRAAARAVDEALSVERVAEAFHATTCSCDEGPGDYDHEHAAALVAHLRGARP